MFKNFAGFLSCNSYPFGEENAENDKDDRDKNKKDGQDKKGFQIGVLNFPKQGHKAKTMSFNPQDHYFKKAKKENYLARSAFKLEEIDQKFKILKPDSSILDLGCAPGSWSQYCLRHMKKGSIVGIDLSEVTLKDPRFIFLQSDILTLNFEEAAKSHLFPLPFDVVMSDMAPKTTGIRMTDQARSLELCEMALKIADQHLKKGGHFICKFFHSEDFAPLKKDIQKKYQRVEAIKPDSTRKISKEIFLVGLNKK